MNPFANWKASDVLLHNERVKMKTARQHNAELAEEYCVTPERNTVFTRESKRVRQSDKPLLNKLEQEYFDILSQQFPNYPRPRAQAIRFRLGNGVTYTPDIVSVLWPDPKGAARMTAFEIKGEYAWDDSIIKAKMAPTIYPEIRWLMVWKENGWHEQELLP